MHITLTSEELKTKGKLADREVGFKNLVHSIAEYSYSVEYNSEGAVSHHSSNSKKITGYEPQDYYRDQNLWASMIYEEDRERVLDFFNEARNSTKEGSSNYYLEHRIRHKNGSIRWVSDSHHIIVKEGKIIREEGFVLDITKHKQAEEELKQIIDNANDGIWVIDKDKRTTRCNPKMASILGVSQDELIGRSIYDFVDEKGAGIFKEMSMRREGENKGMEFEAKLIQPDGTQVPCLFATSSLKGETSASFAIVKNITERKKAEEELRRAKEKAEEATKLKDKFVALVAHDLRSPLATQLGLINILEECHDEPDPDLEKDMVKKLKNNTASLLNMIDRLLDIGQLQTGKIKPFFEKHNLWNITRSIVENLEYSAEDKGINICNRVPEKTEIYADVVLFAEVLQNLITNAIKFCGKGDSIDIFLPEGKENTIAVQDTGEGITEQRLSALFKYEESTSTVGTGGEKGTGLGLPICKDIIEAHNGKIWVESEVGTGSIFYISLPPEIEVPKVLSV